jgi:hypothetical protein
VFGNSEERNMKELTLMIRETGMVNILGEGEAFIKGISLKTFAMDMDKCIGIINLFTRDSGSKARKTDRDKYGRQENLYKKVFMKLVSLKYKLKNKIVSEDYYLIVL